MLDELIARERIRQLRFDYSACYDSWDFDALADLFCEDAVCSYPAAFGGSVRGREAIVAYMKRWADESRAPFDAIHLVANHSVTFESPTKASGQCYLLDWLTRQFEGSQLQTIGGHGNPLLLIGRYRDQYVLEEDGKWRFASVALDAFWPVREMM